MGSSPLMLSILPGTARHILSLRSHCPLPTVLRSSGAGVSPAVCRQARTPAPLSATHCLLPTTSSRHDLPERDAAVVGRNPLVPVRAEPLLPQPPDGPFGEVTVLEAPA